MRRLSLTALLVWGLLLPALHAQSPHGTSFKVSCNKCHSAASWKLDKSVFSFDHNETAMPLRGSHQSVSCRMCHTSLVFNEAKSTCASCHRDIHENTTGPDCERCHNSVSWIVANTNDLHRHTRFPLSGAHQMADCSGCHPSASQLRFEPQGITCVECHRSDFLATTQPNHVQSGFSEQCMDCHSVNSFDWKWNGSQINHSFFPLTAGHAVTDCKKCHTGDGYSGLSTECSSCHLPNYNAATNPNHVAAGFSTTCSQCHSTNPDWKPATINHSFFPLTLGHSITDCKACHTNGNYVNTSSECASCHLTNYNQASNPNHVTAQFPQTCNQCHSTTPGWKPASFDHTQFPLTLGHSGVDCSQCHTNGNYNNTSSECVSCHLADYNKTTDPNHAAAQYPQTCNQCHSTTPGWKPASYDHSIFPLTQGHSGVDCNQCHTNGTYSGTSSECVSCHLTNYNNTTNPNHAAAQYPQTCNQCHSTAPGWKPASFDHSQFPLTQGHSGVDCSQCHTNGNYSNVSSSCISCHQTDYNQTTNPNHGSLGLSTSCTNCHTTTPGWKPAFFTVHDTYFPIYSGKHNGEWNSCTDCHSNTSDYGTFSCLGCHEHNQTDMDREHSGRQGYSYTSSACLECHPRGN